MPRPLSLSVISITAIAYGLITLFPKILLIQSFAEGGWSKELVATMSSSGPVPLPPMVHVSHAVVGSMVWIMAGIFLWRGENWSRWLMVFWGATVLFLTFSVYGLAGSFLWKTGVYALLLIFLFNSGSSRFLGAEKDFGHG